MAVLLIPALSGWLLPRGRARAVDPGIGKLERFVGGLLRWPASVVIASAILAGFAIYGLGRLGTELLPPADPRQFTVRIVGTPGQRVEATARVAEVVEEIIREAAGDDVQAVLAEVGRLPEDDRLIEEEQTEENTARLLVRLAAGGRTARQVVARAAPEVEDLAGVDASWEVGASALARALGTTGPPILVEISGDSLPDLRTAATRIRDVLAERDELWNVRSSFEGGPPELRVVLDRVMADGLGVDMDVVTAALQASLDGRKVTVLSTGDEERDVVIRMPPVRRDELAGIPLTTATGARLALGDVADFVPEPGAREVFRRDQRRVARVTARIAVDVEYPEAMEAATEALLEAETPPGLSVRLAGEEEERARTFEQLQWAALLAILLLFMVLSGSFESLLHPITVLASVPLALIGVSAALMVSGRPIGVMAMLGMIVLAGVAVNDAILLVGTARRLMNEGEPRERALARAAGIRLRPILMTSATTCLALAPLAVGTGEAAALRSPLAITVIFGIITSTIGSLLVIPCLYLLLDRVSPGRRKADP